MPLFRRKKKGGAAQPAQAASVLDFFLKIDSIEGESVDKGHAKEIRVFDFEIGASNTGASATGKGGGKADFKDAVFLIELDKGIIRALKCGSNGEHLKTAVFTARKSGGGPQDYLVWTFTNFIISMVRIEDPGSDAPVMACIALNYTEVKVEYKQQNADGSLGAPVSTSFNLSQGKK